MKKIKILYLMHVDWNWIKQRPHFIAEKLNKNGAEIKVLYHKYYYKKNLTRNEPGDLNLKSIPRLPLSRFRIVKLLNDWIYRLIVHYELSINNYDFVYVTHPTQYLKGIKVPIIYDCMDDVLAFSLDDKNKKKIFNQEKELVNDAKYVFFTAEHLQKVVFERYSITDNLEKYLINNNAIELPDEGKSGLFELKKSNKIKITYIGTVTEWFDFELLESLDENKYEIHLFGPIYNISKNFHNNFIIHGPVDRKYIFPIMNESDILIMPFQVTELIKSVNPVKLYEYIYSCKPVVSVEYGESKKFSDYVYLYKDRDSESLIKILDEIESKNFEPKNEKASCINFVKANTWDSRADAIINFITE